MTSTAGAIAKKMVAEDARWIADVYLSALEGQAGGVIAQLVAGHSARIVYEGVNLLRSSTGVGIPALAALLTTDNEDSIARARHATKLLDDTKKAYVDVLADMAGGLAASRQRFTGNARFKWAERFETDLGIYLYESRVVGITPTNWFRLGQLPSTSFDDLGSRAFEVFRTHGEILTVLAAITGDQTSPAASLSVDGIGPISCKDRKSTKYLAKRFEQSFPEELKLLLLLVEGDLNTARLLFPLLCGAHQEAVFRASVVTLYHGVRTIHRALTTNPQASSPSARDMRAILGAAHTTRILSAHGKAVRNRCMHYEMRGALATASLNPTRPMNGIIEALPQGRAFADYQADLMTVLDSITDTLSNWHA